MRIPNPRLVRLSALTRGAILEKGDSELVISPVVSLDVELSSPINRVFGAGQVIGVTAGDESYLKSDSIVTTGVAGGSQIDVLNLGRGVWVLDIAAVFSFLGTSTVAVGSSVQLVDPEANFAGLSAFAHFNGAHVTVSRRLRLVLQRDSFLVRIATGATIALDFLHLSCSIHAARLL